jgi:K+/H+ antiporter YhaU regulatory subunit KhtT
MVFNPDAGTILESGDTLVAVGRAANIQRLEKLLAPV